jgi:hypothetical protein
MIALIQIDTANYGWIRKRYETDIDLFAEHPDAIFGLEYTFDERYEPIGTRVRLDTESSRQAAKVVRRQLRRAERLSDRLRFARHNCGLEVRAALPGNDRSMRLSRRYADLSSRLALVDAIATILGGGGSR